MAVIRYLRISGFRKVAVIALRIFELRKVAVLGEMRIFGFRKVTFL